jgi:hypothetical protein
MKRLVAVPLACAALIAFAAPPASAHGHHHHAHHVHHGTTNMRDPNFNPLDFPLCFAWDFRLQRDVWTCGRSAY